MRINKDNGSIPQGSMTIDTESALANKPDQLAVAREAIERDEVQKITIAHLPFDFSKYDCRHVIYEVPGSRVIELQATMFNRENMDLSHSVSMRMDKSDPETINLIRYIESVLTGFSAQNLRTPTAQEEVLTPREGESSVSALTESGAAPPETDSDTQ